MRKGNFQDRSVPPVDTTARKSWTTKDSYNAVEIVFPGENGNRSDPSSSHLGFSSRHQVIADMHQLDVVTRAAQDGGISSPHSGIKSNRSLNFSGDNRPVPTIMGVVGQKNTLKRDSTLETSSDGSSASEINLRESPQSSASFCLKRIIIFFLVLLLIVGVGGAVFYFTVISDRQEISANLGVTPSPSPKEEESEKPPAVPLIPESTAIPTVFPTLLPSKSKPPILESLSPSIATSSSPSVLATFAPTLPTRSDPVYPKIEVGGSKEQVATFYAIGDVPYTAQQAKEIEVQIRNIPNDAEFVIHVGDIRNYDVSNPLCREEEYILAADIFKQSPVPVFVIIGDNEWIDCSNPEEGLGFWKKHFLGFDSRHWNHTFDVVQQPGRAYNFAFAHKKTLFIGLNIIGVPVHDSLEWETRLTEEVEWTKALIRRYSSTIGETGRVVIFGHANPGLAHFHFFGPLDQFISQELNNQTPVLYLNGDKHEWSYDPSFQGVDSLLRIMVTGGSSEPPLKMRVVANGQPATTGRAFLHDRRL